MRGVDQPYTTYECIVYDIENGRVAGATAYVSLLDPYVQVRLVDGASLTT